MENKCSLLVKNDRDVHGISSAWDKIVAAMLILAALFASVIAIWTNVSPPAGSTA